MRRRLRIELAFEVSSVNELFRRLLALGLTTDDVHDGAILPDGSILAVVTNDRQVR